MMIITDPDASIVAAFAVRDEAVKTARDLDTANLALRGALGVLLGHRDPIVRAATRVALEQHHLDAGTVKAGA